MNIVDHQIKRLAMGEVPHEIRSFYSFSLSIELPKEVLPMVSPFDPMAVKPDTLLNPASLDIRVGNHADLLTNDGWKEIDLSFYTKENPFTILPYPADRILVSSLETFNIPNCLTCTFKLKSSRGREFYEHLHAGFADPGWYGSKLTMELVNFNTEPLPLYPGLKIGQFAFTLTFGLPDFDYSKTGRYNNDTGAARSRG